MHHLTSSGPQKGESFLITTKRIAKDRKQKIERKNKKINICLLDNAQQALELGHTAVNRLEVD